MKPFRSSGQSFNEIPLSDPKKSSFDLSYTNKGSGKIGRLIPVSQKECLPGDRISCDVHSLLRFEPLAVPLLSDMNLRHHQYFVPFRQVWSSFESFITGGKDGYSDAHVVPSVSFKQVVQMLLNSFSRLMIDIGFQPSSDESASGFFMFLDSETNIYRWRVDYVPSNTSASWRGFTDTLTRLRDLILDFFDEKIGVGTSFTSRYFYNLYYGQGSETCSFDIYRYTVSYVLKRLRTYDFKIISATNQVESVRLLDVFLRDLYDIVFTPFIGPGSNWDYLGYPCDYVYKNGYKGLFNGYTEGDNYMDLDYQLRFGSGDDKWLCAQGIYCPALDLSGSQSLKSVKFYVSANDKMDDTVKFSVLPLRALYRIWYYNYRDQNLEKDVLDPDTPYFKGDSGSNPLLQLLLPRCCAWSKDTFTTATLQAYSTNLVVPIRNETETQLEESTLEIPVVDLPEGTSQNATIKIPTHFVQKDNSPLASISGLTLSNLRKVQALARWLDKNLFVGFQYADQLFSHYNVKYSDARLQIPEYLAGNSEIVRMEVITNNTTIPGAQTAGDQVARAQGLTRSSVDGYFIEEHGLYFAIMSVLPDQSYPFGVDRSLLMTNKFDIAFPEFAQLGSDIVNTGELFFNGYYDFDGENITDPVFFKAFGYQGRYYHYKSNKNEQHGELNTTRREWTFARFFDKAPVLNADFIHCTPNLQMFVSPYSDQFVYDVLINLRAQRSLPVYDQVL